MIHPDLAELGFTPAYKTEDSDLNDMVDEFISPGMLKFNHPLFEKVRAVNPSNPNMYVGTEMALSQDYEYCRGVIYADGEKMGLCHVVPTHKNSDDINLEHVCRQMKKMMDNPAGILIQGEYKYSSITAPETAKQLGMFGVPKATEATEWTRKGRDILIVPSEQMMVIKHWLQDEITAAFYKFSYKLD